ncbi:PaaI family thioesterase [Ottowia thiooxydans]|uniref:PaaI family thioesterase n=1 Tax=Ottowia thiooxydans TaxID=219182 RepID=UPI00041A3FE9|nr:PaaI family thioesterase [Ottowia thiooxydans]
MSLEFGATIPFVNHLGFTLELYEAGESRLHYAPQPEHCNSFGVAHGGALMTFMDVTMVMAARSSGSSDTGLITIEMKTTFMRPASVSSKGEPLVGKGKLLHRTRNMAFVEATIHDAEGQLCATANGTFKFVPQAQPV